MHFLKLLRGVVMSFKTFLGTVCLSFSLYSPTGADFFSSLNVEDRQEFFVSDQDNQENPAAATIINPESNSSEKNGDKLILLPQASFIPIQEEILAYIKELTGKESDKINNSQLLSLLQNQVSQTGGKDPQALYMLGQALLVFAYHPEFTDQISAMVRMGQVHLLNARNMLNRAEADKRTYCRKADNILSEFFSKEFIAAEKAIAESLQAQGKTDEANRLLRILNYKTGSDIPEIKEMLARTYRELAEGDELAYPDHMNAANYHGNASEEAQQQRLAMQEMALDIFSAHLQTQPDAGTEEPSDPDTATLPPDSDGTTGDETPTGLLSQEQVEQKLQLALAENQEGKLDTALEQMREIVTKSSFNAVKPRYFLALQYLFMAQDRRYSQQREQYEKLADLHIEECIRRENNAVETYPDNPEWGSKARELKERLNQKQSTINIETPRQQLVNQGIREALALNDENKFMEALEILRSNVHQTEFKCVKSRYFLAKQYLLMREKDEFSPNHEEFYNTAVQHIDACIANKDKELEDYPENPVWGGHAAELKATLESSAALSEPEKFVLPCPGRVTSLYGMRTHPIHRTRSMHNGIDIGTPKGTPLVAMHNGRILSAQTSGGYGKTVRIVYDNGHESLFAHMDNYKSQNGGTTRSGDRVQRGDKVGEVDSTGLSTGHHLHLEIKKDGERIDPAIILKDIIGRNISNGTSF
jgi:hemerythrin